MHILHHLYYIIVLYSGFYSFSSVQLRKVHGPKRTEFLCSFLATESSIILTYVYSRHKHDKYDVVVWYDIRLSTPEVNGKNTNHLTNICTCILHEKVAQLSKTIHGEKVKFTGSKGWQWRRNGIRNRAEDNGEVCPSQMLLLLRCLNSG